MSNVETNKSKSPKTFLIFRVRTLLWVLFGAALLIVIGVSLLQTSAKDNSKYANWIENESTITRIYAERIFVTHEVEGRTYRECPLNFYSSSYHIEQKLMIKYNPEDPYQVTSLDSSSFLNYGGIGLISAGCAVPVIYAIGAFFDDRHKKKVGKINNDSENKCPTATYTNNK